MQIAGLHQFDNFQNSGNVAMIPRTFNPDGTPVPQMMLI